MKIFLILLSSFITTLGGISVYQDYQMQQSSGSNSSVVESSPRERPSTPSIPERPPAPSPQLSSSVEPSGSPLLPSIPNRPPAPEVPDAYPTNPHVGLDLLTRENLRAKTNRTDRLYTILQFNLSRVRNTDLSSICIFEVVRYVNGINPDQPAERIHSGLDKLPQPFKDPHTNKNGDRLLPSDLDTWKSAYLELTGHDPRINTAITPSGAIASTWTFSPDPNTILSKEETCPTEYRYLNYLNNKLLPPEKRLPKEQTSPEPGTWFLIANANFFRRLSGIPGDAYLLDGHGSELKDINPPTPSQPYEIEGGFNLEQHYLWYRKNDPKNLYLLAGPFYVRRWVAGEHDAECSTKGGYKYYFNIAKYYRNHFLFEEKLTPGIGCGGPPIKPKN